MAAAIIRSLQQKISPAWRGVIVYVFTFFTVGALNPFLNLALDHRGLSESQIGIFNAIPAAITILSAPILSRMADRRRQRIAFTAIGFGLYAMFLAFQALPGGFWWLMGVQILLATVTPPIGPIRDAVAVRMAKKYGLHFGSWRMWGSFGFAIAALLMGIIWQYVGIQWLFLGSSAFFFLSAFIVYLLEEPEEETDIIPVKEVWHEWLPREASVWLFLVANTLAFMAMQPFFHFSAIHMIRLGGTESMAGMMRSASAFVEVFSMWWASRLIKKIGAIWVFLIGAGVFALSWLGFSLATSGWMLIVITAFRGFGFGFATVSAVEYLDAKAKANSAASYQTLATALAMGVGQLVAGPLGGIIAEAVGLSQLFGIASIVGWIAVAFCVPILLLQRRESVRNSVEH